MSAAWVAMRAVSPSRISPTRHDVRVLTQDGAQGVGKRQALLFIDLNLRDAGEYVLDRVFDGHDIDVDRVELGEQRIERRGLARTGRAGEQHDAGAVVGHAAQGLLVGGREAALLQREVAALVEQATDDAFAVVGRQHG